MKKQGKIGAMGIFGFIILGCVLFSGAIFSILRWGVPQQTIYGEGTQVNEQGEPIGITLTTSNECPTTGKTSVNVRAEDSEAGTYTSFASKTVYLMPVKGATGEDANTRDPTEPLYTMTTVGTSGNWSTSQDVTCGKYFKAVLPDVITSSGHAESEVFKAIGQAVYIGEALGLKAPAVSGLQVRVHDIGNDVYFYTEAGSNGFSNLPATFNGSTLIVANNFTTNTVYDFEFIVKVQTANTKGGQENCFIVVDADSSDYQEPAMSFKSTDLSDVFSTSAINSNDKSVLSGNEYAYKIEPMSNSLAKVYASIQSKTDIKPDVSTKFRFVCEGKFKSNEVTDTIVTGIFQDGSTNTEVVLNNATIEIDTLA